MQQLIFTFGVLFFGLASGYVLKILHERGLVTLPIEITALRILLQKIGLMGFFSLSFFLALWVVTLPDLRLSAMPFLCLLALVFGGALAFACARALQLTRPQTGALYCCGSFTNIGAIGGLVCFVMLGEPGFALVPVYKLFEEMYYFTIGLPIAQTFGSGHAGHAGHGGSVSPFDQLRRVLRDPFVLCILAAIVLGTTLNLAGVPRPGWCSSVTSALVPAGTICLLASIGLAMRFSRVSQYLRESLCILGIKFICVPVAITGIGYLLGLGDLMNGLPLQVILVCSSMPVAFFALVPPSLYDLDLDLANSCWVVSTAALSVTLPVLWTLLQLF